MKKKVDVATISAQIDSTECKHVNSGMKLNEQCEIKIGRKSNKLVENALTSAGNFSTDALSKASDSSAIATVNELIQTSCVVNKKAIQQQQLCNLQK